MSKEFGITLPIDAFIKTNSWTGIKSEEIIRQLQFNTDNGGTNLILFDADDDPDERRNVIQRHLDENSVEASIFLFPDNQHKGEVETLLMKLTNREDEKTSFLECYRNYLSCIEAKGINSTEYRLPDHKDMFQAFYSFFRIGNRGDFHNENFWNFSSSEAQALREFLAAFL